MSGNISRDRCNRDFSTQGPRLQSIAWIQVGVQVGVQATRIFRVAKDELRQTNDRLMNKYCVAAPTTTAGIATGATS